MKDCLYWHSRHFSIVKNSHALGRGGTRWQDYDGKIDDGKISKGRRTRKVGDTSFTGTSSLLLGGVLFHWDELSFTRMSYLSLG